METEIKRDYYLDQMIKRKNNGLIKIVTGIRRCGKSYLLRTLFKRYLLEDGVSEDHISPCQRISPLSLAAEATRSACIR